MIDGRWVGGLANAALSYLGKDKKLGERDNRGRKKQRRGRVGGGGMKIEDSARVWRWDQNGPVSFFAEGHFSLYLHPFSVSLSS